MSIVGIGKQELAGLLVDADAVGNTRNEVELTSAAEKALSVIIKKLNFDNPAVERKAISNRGGNYLGVLYEVNVWDGTSVRLNSRELNLFVKCIIPDDKMTMLSVHDIYAKEAYVYSELSDVYEELQSAAGVPEDERYRFVKCHGIVEDRGSEALIFENMAKLGFVTYDRMACMSLRFAELAVIELAKFHALSYALEKSDPDYFDAMIRPMRTPFRFNDDWRVFLQNVSKNTLRVCDSTVIKEKVEQFVKSMLERMPSFLNADDRSVLCHGDYRMNNILIKEKHGEIAEVVPVDYQLIHLGNPLNDFIYLVFGASDQRFRSAHLDNLKNLYRETMRRHMKYFNIDLETLYPIEVFEQDYKERLVYGLMIGINYLPIILAPEDDAPDFGETNFSEIKIDSSDVFEERIRGLVNDFLRWGYL